MATRVVKKTDLVGVSSVAFMRPMEIQFKVTGVKPQTVMYPFFDGQNMNLFTKMDGGAYGGQLKSDAAGNLNGTFYVPPFSFNTGKRLFKLQEQKVYDPNAINGSTFGSASAVFTSSGVKNTLRETVNSFTENTFYRQVNVIDPAPPAPAPAVVRGDPLAQSFFTYGVKGGCFITAIDIYFQSKDDNLPITLQIRELVNGTPGDNLAAPNSSVTKSPIYVNTSNNSSIATKFIFTHPIYLAENRDWCFVLLSNSNKYHVWTSKMSEQSVETGRTIFEQPFIGSLFKSENNATWTAEQSEDIKFTIYKAKFPTNSVGNIKFRARANTFLLDGDKLSTVAGSSQVTVKFDSHHGLRTGDYLTIKGQATAVYNGIPSDSITSSTTPDFSVSVVDDYTVTFNAKSNATVTGNLSSPGIVNTVIVEDGGAGYVSPTITFAPPASGVTATATVQVYNGVITGITMTNRGSGYTSVPTYTLSPVVATPANLTVISESLFEVTTNKLVVGYKPILSTLLAPDTSIASRMRGTDTNYQMGDLNSIKLNEFNFFLKTPNILVSQKNQEAYLPGKQPTEIIMELRTDNENTSPAINLYEQQKLQTFTLVINNPVQINENLPSVESSTAPGSPAIGQLWYDSSISPRLSKVWSGTTWINSELNATGGAAYSKYLTKQFTLQTVSRGVRVFLSAVSPYESNIDLYFRTSLTTNGLNHKTLEWVRMKCDTDTNLSKLRVELIDYTFYLDNLDPFDVYDIKIVMRSSNKAVGPKIANYRTIILAT